MATDVTWAMAECTLTGDHPQLSPVNSLVLVGTHGDSLWVFQLVPHDPESWWSPLVMGCFFEESWIACEVKMTADKILLPWQLLLAAALGKAVQVGRSLWRGNFHYPRTRGLYWGQATNLGWFLPCHTDTTCGVALENIFFSQAACDAGVSRKAAYNQESNTGSLL